MSNLRLAPSFFEACAAVVTTVFGSNFRLAQFVAWNGTDSEAAAPSSLPIVPVTAIGVQLVGLNVKPFAVDETLTALICTGIPSMIAGSHRTLAGVFVVTVSAAVTGSISIFARTTTIGRPGGVGGVALEVKRARLRRVHDREPEGGALVGAGDVGLAARDG